MKIFNEMFRQRIRFIFLSLVLIQLLGTCTYNDAVPPLSIQEEMIFIEPDSSYQFNPNVSVTWNFVGKSAGVLNHNTFTASSDQGVITLQAVANERHEQKKNIRVIVSKNAQLFEQIKSGGFVIYFRHTTATNGVDYNDPNNSLWYLSCDSTVARQLNYPQGYQEASAIGSAMRQMEFQVDSIYSSEFCRVKKTALFFNGTVTTSHKLTFSMDASIDGLRYARTLKMLNVTPSPGKIRILVGHAVLSNAPANDPLTKIQWGDGAVYKIINGEASYVSTIPKGDWMALQ